MSRMEPNLSIGDFSRMTFVNVKALRTRRSATCARRSTRAACGAAVAERAIGVQGPIRENYLVGAADTPDMGPRVLGLLLFANALTVVVAQLPVAKLAEGRRRMVAMAIGSLTFALVAAPASPGAASHWSPRRSRSASASACTRPRCRPRPGSLPAQLARSDEFSRRRGS
jgi:hypothetical protein